MVKAEHIKKSFGELQVLKGISLEVPAGKLYSIVGASGAGKTTLLYILGTLIAADEGKVLIGGEDVSTMGERNSAASGTLNWDLCSSFIIYS